MASSQQPSTSGVHTGDALIVLVLKYLDGGLAGEEWAALESALRRGPAERDLFVELCHLHASLLEVYRGPRERRGREEVATPDEPSGEDTILRGQAADDTVHYPRRPDDGSSA